MRHIVRHLVLAAFIALVPGPLARLAHADGGELHAMFRKQAKERAKAARSVKRRSAKDPRDIERGEHDDDRGNRTERATAADGANDNDDDDENNRRSKRSKRVAADRGGDDENNRRSKRSKRVAAEDDDGDRRSKRAKRATADDGDDGRSKRSKRVAADRGGDDGGNDGDDGRSKRSKRVAADRGGDDDGDRRSKRAKRAATDDRGNNDDENDRGARGRPGHGADEARADEERNSRRTRNRLIDREGSRDRDERSANHNHGGGDDGDDDDSSDETHTEDDETIGRVAFADGDEDSEAEDSGDADELGDVLARLGRKPAKRGMREWKLAIGPNVWAASVDANVSLGSASVSSGVDFMDITRHTKYGAAALVEGRYRRFSVVADLMYAVIGLTGARDVGPIHVALDGEAASLLVDGFVGYRVLGSDQSWLSLEGRAGARYQRTAIDGGVTLAGSPMAIPAQVDAGADGLAGARVFVRPHERIQVVGTADIGVVGSSNRTWSAALDANVRVVSRVLLSVGWRTMTQDRAPVSLVMHGPRVAVQLLF